MELNEITDSNVGIKAGHLVAVLLAQGYVKINDTTYDQHLVYEKKNVVMRFKFESPNMALHFGKIDVLLKEADSNVFEEIGVGDLNAMRIATMGKILGIRSLPKKQRFDRAKYRRNIAEGREEYKRGDK